MCGRLTLRSDPRVLNAYFGLTVPDFRPSWNIFPGQAVRVLRGNPESNALEVVALRWGLVPAWAKDTRSEQKLARSEGIETKPTFRGPFRRRRCLILSDGYYEWCEHSKPSVPHFVHRTDDSPILIAGLWDRWEQGSQPLDSFALITTGANEMQARIHDRMPVILSPEQARIWLDHTNEDPATLLPLLVPYKGTDLEAYPVTTLVNRPANDSPDCLRRAARVRTLFEDE